MVTAFKALRAGLSRRLNFIRPIVYPLLAGLAIRLLFSFFSGQPGDQFAFAAISLGQVYGAGPYANPNNYPPGWDLILGGLGRVVAYAVPPSSILFHTPINFAMNNAIGGWEPLYMVSPVFVFCEKLIYILFDVGTGLLLYLMAFESRFPRLNPRLVFMLWFLNPLVILESSIHGMFDVLPTFFALLGLFFVLRGRPLGTGVSLGISVSLKLFALFLIPIALVLLLRRQHVVSSARRSTLVLFALFALGFSIPLISVFWSPGVLQQYYVYAFTGASVGEGYGGFWIWSWTSLTSLNFVGAWLTAHSALVTDVSLAVGASLAVALAAVPYLSKRLQGENLLDSSALFLCAICASYFADAVVQPQYLVWIMPFLVLWASMKRTLLALMLVIASAAVAFDNLAVGPLYLWQALTYYFGQPSQAFLVSSSLFFYHHESISYPATLIPGFLAVVASVGVVVWIAPSVLKRDHAT